MNIPWNFTIDQYGMSVYFLKFDDTVDDLNSMFCYVLK